MIVSGLVRYRDDRTVADSMAVQFRTDRNGADHVGFRPIAANHYPKNPASKSVVARARIFGASRVSGLCEEIDLAQRQREGKAENFKLGGKEPAPRWLQGWRKTKHRLLRITVNYTGRDVIQPGSDPHTKKGAKPWSSR